MGLFSAEEKGFEPLIPFRVYTLSRRASSTTPALLRGVANVQCFRELAFFGKKTRTLDIILPEIRSILSIKPLL